MTEEITNTNGINEADYLQLFMQELTYQDPLKPVDNREFMAQMAQFSTLQEQRSASESLKALARMASANQSLLLLGKTVKLRDDNRSGIVRSILFPPNSPPVLTISIDDTRLEKKINDIIEVGA